MNAGPLLGQDSTAVATDQGPRRGSEILLPLLSVTFPGLGQYAQGAYWEGAGYTGAAIAGILIRRTAEEVRGSATFMPLRPREQLSDQGYHLLLTSGHLSGWDAFRRALPALRRQGRYDFLSADERLPDLLGAPFDPRFLGRWTTWVSLGYSGLIAGVVLALRDPETADPFRLHDALFVASLAMNAGVGEEAFFRGWLLPVLHQNTGERFGLSNTLQAGVFGAMHLAEAPALAIVATGWGLYQGWLTRRNDWSVRESIFQHFWYNALVGAAIMAARERPRQLRLVLPPVRF